MLERQLLLHSRGGGLVCNIATIKTTSRDPVDVSALSPEVRQYVDLDLTPLCRRYAGLPLSPDNWFVEILSGRDDKRVHRRSHGLVPFGDMAMIVARNYKEVDKETKGFMNEMAERLALYYKDLEVAEAKVRKRRTMMEKEAENERGGGIVGGDGHSKRGGGTDGGDVHSKRETGSKSGANIHWLHEATQPKSHEVFNEPYGKRTINYFKHLPPVPFSYDAELERVWLSYDAELERLRRELELTMSAKIESEPRISFIPRDQIEVHQTMQLNQLQQQHQHE
jgi:hypothetical protein